MKLANVKKWGRGQPLLVRSLAQMIVVSCEACADLRGLVRRGSKSGKVWRLPPPAEWVGLYRRHRQVQKVILESFWPTGNGKALNASFLHEGQAGVRWLRRMKRTEIRKLAAGIDRETVRERWKLGQGLLAELELDSVDEFETPASEARVREAFGRPEFVFFMLVCFPCWLEYGEYAPWLMRRARQGNMEAIEKVLWLDKTAVNDPRISREWQEASRDRNHARFKRLHAALGDGPKGKTTDQKLKVRLAALISAVSEQLANAIASMPGGWRAKKLTAPEIRSLFDALAKDRGRGLIDPDLPAGREALAKAIRREKDWWRFLLPGQK